MWALHISGRESCFIIRGGGFAGSNLGPETGYSDRIFAVLLYSFGRQVVVYFLKIGHSRFVSHPQFTSV